MEEDKNLIVGENELSSTDLKDKDPITTKDQGVGILATESNLEQASLPLTEKPVLVENEPIVEAETLEMPVSEPINSTTENIEIQTVNEDSKPVLESELAIEESTTELNTQTEPNLERSAEKKESASDQNNQLMKNKKSIIAISIILVVVLALIYVASRKSDQKSTDDSRINISVSSELEQGKISIIEETKDDIQVLTSGESEIKLPMTEVYAFFSNNQKDPNSQDCEKVFVLKRQIPKRYDSNMLNSVLALLEPLTTKEKEAGYLSIIPTGTYLEYVKLDDSGVATANFSGTIEKTAGSCAVSAIRSQIKETLMQFASIKSVVICINDNCRDDEILQP